MPPGFPGGPFAPTSPCAPCAPRLPWKKIYLCSKPNFCSFKSHGCNTYKLTYGTGRLYRSKMHLKKVSNMARFGYISYSISKNLVVITVLLQMLQSDWLRHLLSICQKISSSSEYMTLRQRFSKKKLFLYFLVFRNNFDEITNTSLFLLKKLDYYSGYCGSTESKGHVTRGNFPCNFRRGFKVRQTSRATKWKLFNAEFFRAAF